MTMLALMLILAAAPTSGPAATPAKPSPAAQASPAAGSSAKAPQAKATKDVAKPSGAPAAKPSGTPAAKPSAESIAPDPSVPRKPFRWNVPGLVSWVDSAGVQVSDGVPLTLEMALSREPIDRLIQHFADEFQKAGFFIPPGREQIQMARSPQLTAFDPLDKVAYTVIFQENRDKSVTLIFGKSDLSHYQPGAAMRVPAWAPMPAGAKDLMSMEMEGGQNVVFNVPLATSSQEQVMAFYRDTLKKAGFVETEKDPGEFRRPGETIRVSTRVQEGQVVVALTRRLGSDGEGPR